MSDGRLYKGKFANNKFEGLGTLTWQDGKTVYIGEFCSGKREGQGKMKYANGKSYEGQWKAGMEEGEGIQIRKGQKISGKWEAGKLIETNKTEKHS